MFHVAILMTVGRRAAGQHRAGKRKRRYSADARWGRLAAVRLGRTVLCGLQRACELSHIRIGLSRAQEEAVHDPLTTNAQVDDLDPSYTGTTAMAIVPLRLSPQA